MPMYPLAAGPDWGTVPDWLAAVGTLAAFAVALRLLAKELTARREYEEDRRREQARLLSAWAQKPELEPGQAWLPLAIRNGSDEPVYRVQAVMVPFDSPHASDPEAGSTDVQTVQIRRAIVGPGEVARGLFQMIGTGILPGPVGLSFTDAAGRRWKRYPDGRLVEVGYQRRRSRKDYMNAWIAGQVDQLDY